MASTVKPNTEAAQAPPVFSYAQAAKGRATAAVLQSSQATSGVSTPAKDTTHSVANTPAASVNGGGGSESCDRSTTGSFEIIHKSEALEAESKSSVANGTSSPTSPSFGTASTSTLPKLDDISLNGASSGAAPTELAWRSKVEEKSPEAQEGRRGKKGKKSKNAEKEVEQEKEEVKPEVFVPAPPPAVNIWAQRISAYAAKVKPSPTTSQPSAISDAAGVSGLNGAAKPVEPKRRGKASAEEEKASGGAQSGKDSSISNKGQKKGSESVRAKDEPSTKRPARGSRVSEKEEKAADVQLPPPVEDATSWPTPETALEDEKRKLQEKEKSADKEKDERDDAASSNKPRGKDKWLPVPYTPTVKFDTPLPAARGSRGRGGRTGATGRDAGGRHAANGISGEKNGAKFNGEASESLENDGRGDSGVRANSLSPAGSKRQADGENGREGRKHVNGDKSRASGNKNESSSPSGGRRTSTATQTDHAIFQSRDIRNFSDQSQGVPFEGQLNRRSDSNARGADKDQSRGIDGRADRGRGGYRGNRGGGGHAFLNGQTHPQHAFTNGHASQANGVAYQVRPTAGPYSPPLQPPFNPSHAYPANQSRQRGGSRSQSIPNNAMYGRFAPNGMPMAPLQTGMYGNEYGPMQPMSAGPFNPYSEVHSLIAMQLEYYFSIDNLCKDVFMRKHMDSQGFVFLSFVAGFKRMKSLTTDEELLRFACSTSNQIELVQGDDGIDRLRRRVGWEKFVMRPEDREDSMKNNEGPKAIFRSGFSPRMNAAQNDVMAAYNPANAELSFGNGTGASAHAVNGNGNTYHSETPLSAAVPDFAPGLLAVDGAPDPLESEVTFTDEEVLLLNVVFKAPVDEQKKRNTASRTFSNGSIDGRSISQELQGERQGRTLVNGHTSETLSSSPESVRRPRSPSVAASLTSVISNSPPVLWVKNQDHPSSLPGNIPSQPYLAFRDVALRARQTSAPGETDNNMKLLYEFWSHFLCRNFNAKMYSEFRMFALQDAANNSRTGTNELLKYFDAVLRDSKKTIPSTLAQHYVELVRGEDKESSRPAFSNLRAAWQNTSLDIKSRKKIESFLDAPLKEQLEG